MLVFFFFLSYVQMAKKWVGDSYNPVYQWNTVCSKSLYTVLSVPASLHYTEYTVLLHYIEYTVSLHSPLYTLVLHYTEYTVSVLCKV